MKPRGDRRVDGQALHRAFWTSLGPRSGAAASRARFGGGGRAREPGAERAYILFLHAGCGRAAGCWASCRSSRRSGGDSGRRSRAVEPADAVWPADDSAPGGQGRRRLRSYAVSVKLSPRRMRRADGAPTFYATLGLTGLDLMEIELACFEGDPIEMVGYCSTWRPPHQARPIIKHATRRPGRRPQEIQGAPRAVMLVPDGWCIGCIWSRRGELED